MFFLHALAGLVAKVASASTIAQATAGLGIAVAGVTGAGAAGVLPGPVQDAVAGAVEIVTPFDLPDSSDDQGAGVDGWPSRAADGTAGPAADQPRDTLVSDPTRTPTTTTTATPSDAPEVDDHGRAPEAEEEDGVHEHRGGASESTADREDGSGSVSARHGDPHEADRADDHSDEGSDDADETTPSTSTSSHDAEDDHAEDDHADVEDSSGHGGEDSDQGGSGHGEDD